MNLGKPITVGNTAEIYLYDGKVIKLFNDYLPDTEAEYEANKQRYAYSCKLLVPYIYEVKKIDGKQAILMEYIAGRTIGSIIYEDWSKVEQYMEMSVDVQLQIHSVETNGFELMTDKLSNQILSASLLSKRQKNVLLEKMYSIKYSKKLCHGDYHVFNLILGDNCTAIIDWVDSSAGDIRADVYRTYLLYSQYSIELANIYLQLYCNKSGISKEEIFYGSLLLQGQGYQKTYHQKILLALSI